MITSLGYIEQPVTLLKKLRSGTDTLVTFDFSHHQVYLPDTPTMTLTVICLVMDAHIQCAISDQPLASIKPWHLSTKTTHLLDVFLALTHYYQLARVEIDKPWLLDRIHIAKPWGAEIWYTGIEQRGICSVKQVPLPWLLELFLPEVAAPILLKILDPLPHANYGDLYFELHEQKTEVYVVTHLDKQAWPDGIGKIRYGFKQSKLAEFSDITAFKRAYLAAVIAYRAVREEIDGFFDQQKLRHGYAPDIPLDPLLLDSWQTQLPQALSERETSRREIMHSFTAMQDIGVGDVIQILPYFPHALQHGVRVVELQTAHYQRHILSFTHQVLTQNHWDTEAALTSVITSRPKDKPLQISYQNDTCTVENIADFAAFTASRISLNQDKRHTLVLNQQAGYGLVMAVTGRVVVNNQLLEPEQACLVTDSTVSFTAQDLCVFILATPKPTQDVATQA